jgi:TrmH family RNA methyltransferase
LDRIQDPGNLGALVRSAEATSVAGIGLAPGCAHPNNPKALRASAGSLLRVPVAVSVGLEAVLAHLSNLSPTVVALDPSGGEDLYDSDLEGCMILALGTEGSGLPPELRSRADLRITIPVAEPVQSLNVTVAASVALHEIARRRRATM